jgi:ribosomal protein L31E
MKTSDVRIDVKLNKAVWSKGIRNVRIDRSRALTVRLAARVLDAFETWSRTLT